MGPVTQAQCCSSSGSGVDGAGLSGEIPRESGERPALSASVSNQLRFSPRPNSSDVAPVRHFMHAKEVLIGTIDAQSLDQGLQRCALHAESSGGSPASADSPFRIPQRA
jgi:hypothetical protein